MGEAQPLIFDIEEESIDDLLQDSPKTEETDVETDNEDEVKVIPTLVSPYTYINDQLRKTEDHEDIITLNPDLDLRTQHLGVMFIIAWEQFFTWVNPS